MRLTVLICAMALCSTVLISCSSFNTSSTDETACEWEGTCTGVNCPVSGKCCSDSECPNANSSTAVSGACEFCNCENCSGTGKCENCPMAEKNKRKPGK